MFCLIKMRDTHTVGSFASVFGCIPKGDMAQSPPHGLLSLGTSETVLVLTDLLTYAIIFVRMRVNRNQAFHSYEQEEELEIPIVPCHKPKTIQRE